MPKPWREKSSENRKVRFFSERCGVKKKAGNVGILTGRRAAIKVRMQNAATLKLSDYSWSVALTATALRQSNIAIRLD